MGIGTSQTPPPCNGMGTETPDSPHRCGGRGLGAKVSEVLELQLVGRRRGLGEHHVKEPYGTGGRGGEGEVLLALLLTNHRALTGILWKSGGPRRNGGTNPSRRGGDPGG